MTLNQTVTVFGAYGHTGRFVVSELRKRGWIPILSGRDADKLNAVGDAHRELEVRVASVDDPASLARAISGAQAVINCAGPFIDTAAPVIEAALRDPAVVAQVVGSIIDAGAVGINIEDGADPPDLLCAKIESARQSAARAGVDLFINARTDVYRRSLAMGEEAVEEVVRRAERYRAAGCDGLFVPGLADGSAIKAVATAIDPLPLNIMLLPDLPTNDVLQTQGVRRLNTGSAIAQAVVDRTSQLATSFLAGAGDEMFIAAVEYGAMNRLFTGD